MASVKAGGWLNRKENGMLAHVRPNRAGPVLTREADANIRQYLFHREK